MRPTWIPADKTSPNCAVEDLVNARSSVFVSLFENPMSGRFGIAEGRIANVRHWFDSRDAAKLAYEINKS